MKNLGIFLGCFVAFFINVHLFGFSTQGALFGSFITYVLLTVISSLSKLNE